MCGVQTAVVAEHGLLVDKHPVKQSTVGVIPKRDVGQQVNESGDHYKKHQAEKNCVLGIGAKVLDNVQVWNTIGIAERIFLGQTIFQISLVQYGKEYQRQAHSCINAGPFGGNAKPHTNAAGA